MGQILAHLAFDEHALTSLNCGNGCFALVEPR